MKETATDRPITRADIESKLRELQGETSEMVSSARDKLIAGGVVIVLGLILLAFVTGRRRGLHKATFVEIRRI